MRIKPINKFLKSILGDHIVGITLCPFGIYLKNFDKYTINHEQIHWQQQLEMLVLPFYIFYGLEYLVKLIIYGKDAYRNLSFEREAYANDDNLEYLKNRKHYAWVKYIFNNGNI